MRRGAFFLVMVLVVAAAPAEAVETRCGISSGIKLGATIPSDPEIHNEYDYLFRLEANVKYYLVWGLSIAGGLGYQYGQGAPERFYNEEEKWVEFDTIGVSFWRSMPVFGTLRIEFWRMGKFNPYIGGGGGITYLTMYRKGYELNQPVSNGADEWVPHYYGLVGFDYAFHKYFAILFEGKYRILDPTDPFFDDYQFGGWDILGGLNVYF